MDLSVKEASVGALSVEGMNAVLAKQNGMGKSSSVTLTLKSLFSKSAWRTIGAYCTYGSQYETKFSWYSSCRIDLGMFVFAYTRYAAQLLVPGIGSMKSG